MSHSSGSTSPSRNNKGRGNRLGLLNTQITISSPQGTGNPPPHFVYMINRELFRIECSNGLKGLPNKSKNLLSAFWDCQFLISFHHNVPIKNVKFFFVEKQKQEIFFSNKYNFVFLEQKDQISKYARLS